MRIRLLVLLLAVFATTVFADEWNKDFAVGAHPKLNIDTNDASIRVTASTGNRISAHVWTEGYKLGPTDVRVIDRQSGDSVDLTVRIPSRTFSVGHHYVRVEVSVPAATQLQLRSGDGRLTVRGTRAPAQLITSDGSIEVSDFEGPLSARSGDGRITVDGRFEDLQLETGDGSIEAEVRPGSKMAGRWFIRSGDGRVNLRLPDAFTADLDAHTGDGRVTVDFPVTLNGSLNENTVRGKLNGGGQMLQLRTSDGSIHVGRF